MAYSELPLMDIPPRDQIAVWWKVIHIDLYGRSVYASPEEFNCRWDDVTEEFVDAEGVTQFSRAKVFPDRELKPGDVLWLGKKALLTDPAVPENNDGYSEIRQIKNLHDFDITEVLYIAYL